MKMDTPDKIASIAVIIAIGSAIVSTWTSFKVGTWDHGLRETELKGRLVCQSGVRGDEDIISLTNNSLQHPVKILFLNAHSPISLGEDAYSSRSERYGAHIIKVGETVFFLFPGWSSEDKTEEINFVMQWESPDLKRKRLHRCDLERWEATPRHQFRMVKEEDEWLRDVRFSGYWIPEDATLHKPIKSK